MKAIKNPSPLVKSEDKHHELNRKTVLPLFAPSNKHNNKLKHRALKWAVNIVLLCSSLVLTYLLTNLVLGKIFPQLVVKLPLDICECSYLYRMLPNHEGFNSLGIRSPEVAIPKPSSTYRILVLGDSVSYGMYLPQEAAFPAVAESILNSKIPTGKKLEVINGSIPAYTPFNEYHFYKDFLWKLEPDLVVTSFCMNDVVNPRLHWSYTGEPIPVLPPEAIPNPEYDKTILSRTYVPWWLSFVPSESNLRRYFMTLLRGSERKSTSYRDQWPIHLTLEDSLSIDVYHNYDSPEWVWLRNIYQNLQHEVESHSAKFMVLWLPLAYQLDPQYPFSPEAEFEKYCSDNSLTCLHGLSFLKGKNAHDIFQLERSGYEDIWHLTPHGHRIVAEKFVDFISDSHFMN